MGWLRDQFTEAVTGAPTGVKTFVVLQQYVRHVIDNEPRATAVTMTVDEVPGSRWKVYSADVLGALKLRIIQEQYTNPEEHMRQALSKMRRKVESGIEPSTEEWRCLLCVVNGIVEAIDR